MFSGVFQGVTKSANETLAFALEKIGARVVDFLFLDPDNLGSVLRAADHSPDLDEQLLWNMGTNVDPVRVKVGIVTVLPRVPTTELVAPKKPELVRLDVQLSEAPLHAFANIFVK